MTTRKPVVKKGASSDTRNIVTIILLLLTFVVPVVGVIGVLVMWFWTTWKKWVKILITLPFTLIPLSIIFLFLFFRPFQVSGQTMAPNYKNGEYIFTSIYNPENMTIHRGDVIIFRAPPDPQIDFIKRVIGLPGDFIELRNGYVYLNGKKLDESAYLQSNIKTAAGAFLHDGQPFKIPAYYYFVMGDNRQFSSDSREWGLVPQKNIISKVEFCYWNCK